MSDGFREGGLRAEEPSGAGNAVPLCVLSQDPSQAVSGLTLPSITAFSCFSMLSTGSTACPAPDRLPVPLALRGAAAWASASPFPLAPFADQLRSLHGVAEPEAAVSLFPAHHPQRQAAGEGHLLAAAALWLDLGGAAGQ